MPMNDPIADMLTRIRNGNILFKPYVVAPYSRLKEEVLKVLAAGRYVKEYETIEESGHKTLRIHLRYLPGRRRAITEIIKVSKPGVRRYVSKREIPVVRDGLGIAVMTTPKGVMSNAQAKEMGIGGEVLCQVW